MCEQLAKNAESSRIGALDRCRWGYTRDTNDFKPYGKNATNSSTILSKTEYDLFPKASASSARK